MKHLILWASFAATLGAAAAFLYGRDGAFEIFTITGLLTLGLFILVDEHEADKRWRARRYRADVWERRDREAGAVRRSPWLDLADKLASEGDIKSANKLRSALEARATREGRLP